MKKYILLFLAILGITSCTQMRSIETNLESQGYGKACEHPVYIATVARDADQMGGVLNSVSLRLAVLVREAQAKYGNDATVENVRWDLQNGKRRSVVYDVVKCK